MAEILDGCYPTVRRLDPCESCGTPLALVEGGVPDRAWCEYERMSETLLRRFRLHTAENCREARDW